MDSAREVDAGLLELAMDLACRAGELTLRWFGRPDLAVQAKRDGTPVTEADRAAERMIREAIVERFPADAIVGEEEADRPGSSGRRWVIDPIDGTKAFTRGVPLYTTLIAIEDESGPAVGVIRMPALRETVAAARGHGCFHDGAPARVSTTAGLDRAYVSSSGFESWTDAMLAGVRTTGCALRTWGDGYGYALVATGRVDAMVDVGVQPYDVAAMPVILSEAGGRFTDLTGSARTDGGSGLGTNGLVHDALLVALGAGSTPLRA